jgi:hypothetical protein
MQATGELSKIMVDTGKHIYYILLLSSESSTFSCEILNLALVLPAGTVTVERCFLVMKLVKT